MCVNKRTNEKMSKSLGEALRFKCDFPFQGDSGSPLIREGVFRGVTSFGKCGDSRKPGVYILLTKKYLNWIRKAIEGPSDLPTSKRGQRWPTTVLSEAVLPGPV